MLNCLRLLRIDQNSISPNWENRELKEKITIVIKHKFRSSSNDSKCLL